MSQELFHFKVSLSLDERPELKLKSRNLTAAARQQSVNPLLGNSSIGRTVHWHCKTCLSDKRIPLDSQGKLIFDSSHQEFLDSHIWKRGCRLQLVSDIPECQHLVTKGPPVKEEVCTPLPQRATSGQTSKGSQLSQVPPLPQLQGDTLAPIITETEPSPPQERILVQKPKATCAPELVVPVAEGPHSGKKGLQAFSGKSSRFRPGPQRYEYPKDTSIHRSLIAAKGQLSNTAPHKSGRFYPFGTEPIDVQRVFAPQASNNSRLKEVHQLYSDLTLQITRATETGYSLTSQKLASPKD
jgi:hypothetical protein